MHRIQNANTNGKVGYCLDVLDLFMSKAWAGRDKDRHFCIALVEHGYVRTERALALVTQMPLNAKQQRDLRARIRRWSNTAKKP